MHEQCWIKLSMRIVSYGVSVSSPFDVVGCVGAVAERCFLIKSPDSSSSSPVSSFSRRWSKITCFCQSISDDSPKTESTDRARSRRRLRRSRRGESGRTGLTWSVDSFCSLRRRFNRRDRPLNGLNRVRRLFIWSLVLSHLLYDHY